MRKVAFLGVLLSAPQAVLAQNGVTNAVSSITAEDFIRRVGVIAHDSMRGRDTPSHGLNMTAQYIADEFRRMGLSPAAPNGSFLQEYPLIRERVDTIKINISGDNFTATCRGEMLSYSDEEVAAASQAAHERGVWLACHSRSDDSVRLEITSEDPNASGVIEMLTGAPSR